MSCITYQGRAGGVHPMIIMREEESCMNRFKEQAMKIVFMVAACASVLAVFLICLFRKRWLSIFIVLWAFTNSYTRLYLGLHYPGDLVAGAIIGGFGGWLFYFIAHKLTARLQSDTPTPALEKGTGMKQTEVMIYTGLLTLAGIIIYSIVQS